MSPFNLFKRSSNKFPADRILAPQQIDEILADDYENSSDAIIFVFEQSKRISPTEMMFLPLIISEFSEDNNLAMIYGTGSGCALIRKAALQKVKVKMRETHCAISKCQDLIDEFNVEGYTIRLDRRLSIDLLD